MVSDLITVDNFTVRALTAHSQFKEGTHAIVYRLGNIPYRLRVSTAPGGVGEIICEWWSDAREVWCTSVLTVLDLGAERATLSSNLEMCKHDL